MRILIVGAGIGGMTLAALLERQDVEVALVERAPDFDHAGYMLGLWPLGYRVLHGLGLYERFAAGSIEGRRYEVRNDRGDIVKQWSLAAVTEQYGPNLSCTRPQLVKLLQGALGRTTVRFSTPIEALVQQNDEVEAFFANGSSGTFDLVVGADGQRSRVRELLFGEQPAFHTGWGGWVWWAPLDTVPSQTFVEHWGTARFMGAYPTRDGAGIFAGAPLGSDFEQPGPGRRDRILQRFSNMGGMVDTWIRSIPGDDEAMFFWRLSDVRAGEWTQGRVVLLGDAAAGFLPTAGIGASMAMESAAVLADELSRTGARFVERALAFYVQRRRKRVERIQDESRRLARTMFVKSPPLAHVRNLATKLYSVEGLAGSIAEAFDEPI